MRLLVPVEELNDVWAVDFKGWWMSGGERAYVPDAEIECTMEFMSRKVSRHGSVLIDG